MITPSLKVRKRLNFKLVFKRNLKNKERKKKIKIMSLKLFFFLVFISQINSECSFDFRFKSVCVIRDYKDSSCQKDLNLCPKIKTTYNTYCKVLICKVKYFSNF